MPRRTATKVLSAILITLGLASLAASFLSNQIWPQRDQVAAHMVETGDAGNAVITEPGVLNLVNTDVTIRATVPDDQPVTMVIGRDVDVAGWVGDSDVTHVTGLSDWENLSVIPAADLANAVPDPAGSDLWVAEVHGNGTVEMQWQALPGRWSMMAVGASPEQTPSVELVWPTAAMVSPWRWPLIGAGIALTALGSALAMFGPRKRPALIEVPTSELIERTGPWSPVNPSEQAYVEMTQSGPVLVQSGPVQVAPVMPAQPMPVPTAALPEPPMPSIEEYGLPSRRALRPEPTPVVPEPQVFVEQPVALPEPTPVVAGSAPQPGSEPTPLVAAVVGGAPVATAAPADGQIAQGRVFASEATFEAPAATSRREVKMLRKVGELTSAEPIIPPVVVHEWPSDWVIEIAEVAE